MPTIAGGGKLRGPRRRTMRNSVSLLTLTLSRREKGGSRSASKRNSETVDHIIEAARTSRSWSNGLEPFGKDPPLANRSVAEEATPSQNQRYSHACGRKIRQSSSILTVAQMPPHVGHRQTLAAPTIAITKSPSPLVVLSTTNQRETSSETSNVCMALIPCPNQTQSGASTSSKVSQSRKVTPRGGGSSSKLTTPEP